MSMTSPASPANHDPYAPWRSADYRNYSASWFLITFSRQVEFAAIGIYLSDKYDATQASFALGLMGLVQALPIMLLAIAGGHLADRFDRRAVTLLAYSLGVGSSAALLAMALLHGDIWWIYLLLGVGAVGWALGNPARQALLPQLIPKEIFPNAIAWISSVFQVARVTGPVIGGAIMGICKVRSLDMLSALAAPFALVLLCRLIAVVAIGLIRARRTTRGETSLSWESVMAGIRFVWHAKLILATVTLDLFAVLLGGAMYLVPVFAAHILLVGPLGCGFLLAADAIGAICMAVFLAHRPPMRRAGVTLLWAVAGFGVTTIIFGLSQWFWLSLAMLFLLGALDGISVVVRHTLVQMLTPDEMRGRVSAVNGVFIVASNDLGGLESGVTAGLFGQMFGPALGPVISVVGGGIGVILVVLGTIRLWPQVLKIGSLASIQPVTPDLSDDTKPHIAEER
jgi:MFS family permease